MHGRLQARRFSDFSGNHGHVVVEDDELVGAQGERGVGASLIIAELDLEHSGGKRLDDGPDLAPAEPPLWHVFKQRNDGKGFDDFHGHSEDVATGQAGKVFSAQDDPTAAHGGSPSRTGQLQV